MMHKHQENFQKLCRLCGGYISKDAVGVLKCQEKIKHTSQNQGNFVKYAMSH